MAKKKTDEIKETLNSRANKNTEKTWISTGSTISDLVVGCGSGLGVATGQLVNIAGPSGGGKTAATMTILACANRDYGDRLRKRLRDTENGNTFDVQSMFGFTFTNDELATNRTVEETHADINVFLRSIKKDEIGIDITDSLDGLMGSETDNAIDDRIEAYEKEKEYDVGSFGMGKAKYLSTTMLPDLASKMADKDCLTIITSQLRDNPNAGMYGVKERVSNGRALLFYSHVQLWIKKKQKIEVGGTEIGSVVEYNIKKGRGPQPYRSCLVTLYYTMGVDSISSDVDYLYDFRSDKTGELLAKSSRPLDWNGTEFLNRDALIQHIDDNDLLDELKEKVMAKWDEHEREILESLSSRKNRFLRSTDGK